MNKHMHVHF